MKKFCVIILALVSLMLLAGCSCEHQWTEADCLNPRICTECGEREGKALGHRWADATCTTVQTCTVCGRTEGSPLGHIWIEATCAAPKTCSACGEIVGDVLEHTWIEATTEAPKTCSACGAVEGEKIAVDPRFVTANNQKLFGTWTAVLNMTGEDLEVEGFEGTLKGSFVMAFNNVGEMECHFELEDEAAFRQAMIDYYTAYYLAELEEAEVDEETGDLVTKALVGQTAKEYLADYINELTVDEVVEELLAESNMGDGWAGKFVYYAEGESLFWDLDWKDTMYESKIEFIGTKLMLEDFLEFTAADVA